MHSECKKSDLLEKIFKIKPINIENFEKALTHGSFTKEQGISSKNNYERLEFLGDAVLKLCMSDILYKKFPKYSEGDLSKIRSIVVSDSTLAQIAKEIGLPELIILSKQEEKMGGRNRQSILACVFEALLGAYYIDGKFAELSVFLEKKLSKYIKDVDENFAKYNAKAILQEYTQSQDKKTPVYKTVEEVGPSHNKTFMVEVSYGGEVLALESGKTKKEAEQNCAYKACVKLGVIK